MDEIFQCTGVNRWIPYFHILIVIIATTNPLQLKVLVFHIFFYNVSYHWPCPVRLLPLLIPSCFQTIWFSCLTAHLSSCEWEESKGCFLSPHQTCTRKGAWSICYNENKTKQNEMKQNKTKLSLLSSLFCRLLDKHTYTKPERDFLPWPHNFLLYWVITQETSQFSFSFLLSQSVLHSWLSHMLYLV